jgi:hypothetical protein
MNKVIEVELAYERSTKHKMVFVETKTPPVIGGVYVVKGTLPADTKKITIKIHY